MCMSICMCMCMCVCLYIYMAMSIWFPYQIFATNATCLGNPLIVCMQKILCMHKILVHAQDSCACTRFSCMHTIKGFPRQIAVVPQIW